MVCVRYVSRLAVAGLKEIAAKKPNNSAAVMSVNQRTKEKKREKSITFVALMIFNVEFSV